MCPSTETHTRTLSLVQQVPCFYARRNLRLEPESLISERALCAFARTSLKCPWAVRIGLVKDEKERRKQRQQETTDLELGFFLTPGFVLTKLSSPSQEEWGCVLCTSGSAPPASEVVQGSERALCKKEMHSSIGIKGRKEKKRKIDIP